MKNHTSQTLEKELVSAAAQLEEKSKATSSTRRQQEFEAQVDKLKVKGRWVEGGRERKDRMSIS
jgi:hypothetical protein